MGNGGNTGTICQTGASGIITYYALVSSSRGNDSRGTVGYLTYLGLNPFRSINAAINALSRTLNGKEEYERGQVIMAQSSSDDVYYQSGDVTLNNKIFLRGGDSLGTLNSLSLYVPTLNIRGRLILNGNNRLENLIIRSDGIIGSNPICGGSIYFYDNLAQVRGNDNYFFNITNSNINLYNTTISTSNKGIFNIKDTNLILNKCNIVGQDMEVAFNINNSSCSIINCHLETMATKVMEVNESNLEVKSSNIVIEGKDVIFNENNNSNINYEVSFINVKANKVSDVTKDKKIKYNNDLLLGNYIELLNDKTAEYNVLTNNGYISSNQVKVLRGITHYVINTKDIDIIFKKSDMLVIILPVDSYNGRKLTLKFIDVKERRLEGRFNKDDVEKLKTLKVLNLEYVDGVWYLM
ncbi:Hypothetical protein ORPV_547 [Orpheovirus IHUMI-LCC2]|uniref:Uncharacterized protein n=1 Tax=Orpheovirus IHUMI-LCC2 TaxID=2023057 RepID=A0A2I2L4L6_9VIRU|nr:Hypothetical protein ORPV_547 [Orpheovirus IHUMI-LCC2]SNW62451.1 Hypothetical protein ORPV_547 [Orpheovirus IHUMI-LCC2]